MFYTYTRVKRAEDDASRFSLQRLKAILTGRGREYDLVTKDVSRVNTQAPRILGAMGALAAANTAMIPSYLNPDKFPLSKRTIIIPALLGGAAAYGVGKATPVTRESYTKMLDRFTPAQREAWLDQIEGIHAKKAAFKTLRGYKNVTRF